MEVTIKGEAHEISALVLAVQRRRTIELRDPLRGLNHQEDSLRNHSTPAKDA